MIYSFYDKSYSYYRNYKNYRYKSSIGDALSVVTVIMDLLPKLV